MSKKYFQQAITILLAALILVVGRGYGSLTHTCEEHGRHSHLIVNTESQAHEHKGHPHDKHHEEAEDGRCYNNHESADLQFVSIYAESIVKAQPDFTVSWIDFSALPTISYLPVSELANIGLSGITDPPFLRRPYGRQLLAWVQSFLI
jgi:hypothetical protein